MIEDSDWYKTQLKIQKIQMRAHCMRARSPPKSLLRATSRENIKEEMTMMAGARSATNLADQLIQQGILNDQQYDHMRQTLRSSKGSTFRNTGTLSLSPNKSSTHSGFGSPGQRGESRSGFRQDNYNTTGQIQVKPMSPTTSSQFFEQRQPSRQSGSHSPLPGNTLSSSPFSPSSQVEQQGKLQNNNNTEDYSLHPMVRELTSRALTTQAGMRKLQATVKKEVELKLKETENDLDLKNVSIF